MISVTRWTMGGRPIRRLVARALCHGQRLYQQPQAIHATSRTSSEGIPITNKLEVIEPLDSSTVPSFQALNSEGDIVGDVHPELTLDKVKEFYQSMLLLNSMDRVMFDSQRQGRISFYMTGFGEEAIQIGSAGALNPDDWVYAQYREAGILLHRKMSLDLMVAQCYGNKEDLGKGRQMPIHYGNRSLNHVTISSPLATQMPQAVGTAYAFKRAGKDMMVACYFGEGAASEGDAHAAMNFASTLDCPVLFFCRNNGYAISTPVEEQLRGDGVITRAKGYGMPAIRVDGNDLLAVFTATKEARRICLEQSRPVLLEAMSYRVGHHSTSDDSTAYRSADEVKQWDQYNNPLIRVRRYLEKNNSWSDELDKKIRADARARVIEALGRAEKMKRLHVTSMFDDVYDELPDHLIQQRDELKAHLQVYGNEYPLNEHEGI